jgi:ferredoxin--NADP+ reductase
MPKQTITLIIQAVGHHARHRRGARRSIRDIAGPLGQPTEIEYSKGFMAACRTAVLFPLAKASRRRQRADDHRPQRVSWCCATSWPSSRTRSSAPEDGSLGERVHRPAAKRILEGEGGDRPDAAHAIGPVPMMKAVAELTRRVHTVVRSTC